MRLLELLRFDSPGHPILTRTPIPDNVALRTRKPTLTSKATLPFSRAPMLVQAPGLSLLVQAKVAKLLTKFAARNLDCKEEVDFKPSDRRFAFFLQMWTVDFRVCVRFFK